MKVVCSWAFTKRHSRGRPGAIDCGMAYLLGLRDLGHEVYLFEEVGQVDCLDTWHEPVGFDAWSGLESFERVARAYGIWPDACLIYNGGEATHGISFEAALRIASEADLLLDIGTSLSTTQLVERFACRAYVDEAPAKTQAYHSEYGLDQGLDLHHFFFTTGLNVGRPGCEVPTCGVHWHGIVHPVVLSMWPAVPVNDGGRFTTVSNWAGKETFQLNGRYSGEKSDQWHRYLELPAMSEQQLEIALNVREGYEGDVELLRKHGWLVADAARFQTLEDYRTYIGRSRAEFSVANNRYVEFATGWTSDRSARYLASAKPVLCLSTGIEERLPTGRGLLTFSDPDGALAGIESINGDYAGHCGAARAMAEEHFGADRVLGQMLQVIGL